jgi:hypothetical protein
MHTGQMPGSGPHPNMPGPGAMPLQQTVPGLAQRQPTVITTKAKAKASKQVIVLVIVGIICLAIFATGIVLFVTTKF